MKKQHHSLTLLASACFAILSVNATAATDADNQLAANQLKVPGVIDSSVKRVIRASTAAAQPVQTTAENQQTATQAIQQTSTTVSDQSTPAAIAAEDLPKPAVRVYQPSSANSNAIQGIDLQSGQLGNIPTPSVSVSNATFVPTVLIPQTTSATAGQLDVSLLDDFIQQVSPNARHYPPNFPNKSQAYNTREKIKVMTAWIDPYASASNASYDVLLRAAKLNGMARNLDMGSDYAIKASTYVAKAINLQPNSAEANFLYGMMLTEGGGFKEGKKYLDKAASLGYVEAEQSLAQSDLLSDRRSEALQRLRQLQNRMPNDPIIQQQIKIVEDGKFYIWDIPAPNINIKPVS